MKHFEYCKPRYCSLVFEDSIAYCMLFLCTFFRPCKLSATIILYIWRKCVHKEGMKCLGDFKLTPMNFSKADKCTLSIHSWLSDNPHISEPYVRIGCIYLSNILKKISGKCSPIDHRSFTVANIPFLARFARSSRVGENVSLVVRYIPRYLYLFTISST